jgi:hypothetical protein
MKEFLSKPYYKPLEDIVDVLVQRTRSTDRSFYYNLVNFYFCQIASNMRCSITSLDRGTLPVNFYGVSFATSGLGKGFSNNIIVDQVIGGFRKEFTKVTYPHISNYWLEEIAKKTANTKGTEFEEEMVKVQKDFDGLGELLFSFDSGSLAGMKQLRQKMLMSRMGSLSFIADEIGSNLLETGVMDILKGFLELFDMGKIGDKLLVNSVDRKRIKQIYGVTPANMLLFGTQSKVFDGGVTESTFKSLMTTGFARRCFFAFSDKDEREFKKTEEEIYEDLTNNSSKVTLKTYYDSYKELADSIHYNIKIEMRKEVSLILIRYQKRCEQIAQEFNDNELEKKAELEHSYWKVLKLAGAYAFLDKSDHITPANLYAAIRCAIDSSNIFQEKVIEQDPSHVRLLKYLCNKPTPSTYADMVRDLPFFPTTIGRRHEILTLAASQGYLDNISIIHTTDNDIDLYTAKYLEETNLDEMIISYSDKISRDYENSNVPYSKLHKLIQEDGYHWVNHHLEDGTRNEDSVYQGFNLVVLDLDRNVDISTVNMVFKEYKCLIYTTKSHTKTEPRFRAIIPLSHVVELGSEGFAKFMKNIYEWLPFNSDEVTNQRSRKWLSNRGKYFYNKGKLLLDAHQFIPQTTKAVALNTSNSAYLNLPKLERWFIRQVNEGAGRNNSLVKYAFALLDAKMSHGDIMTKVSNLNQEFKQPLADNEINSTINVTVARQVAKLEK